MSERSGFLCSGCGQHHDELPMNFSAPAPDLWSPLLAEDPESYLTSDLCVIKGQAFFVHGLVEIPVTDTGETFSWGVWVSLSRDNFDRTVILWETPGRESEPAYFGWLSTSLPLYSPATGDLKTNLHTRPIGERPFIELEPTDHPLAVEQRTGITRARVQQIVEFLLHPGQP
ncbi:DUF2199 domain-containing protein [Actinomadura violacea]|uniref:DUF2199 domain-containing protein n=1 Tax=Actinomadura violacea TaxID=2819934 RepID=A0ABS3RNM7_9ACTN|nr:DUF2199 domain-containing protein [Actinomadura violacea]MBO2458344.1 DUF2199 domain-containing protein [Actinomadura violacea]